MAKQKVEKIKAAELVFDGGLYPRGRIDTYHVHCMREAMAAGTAFPPIVACRKSKRIVDGAHRVKAAMLHGGDDATIEVEWREYPHERDLFLEAIRLNANHGQALTAYDRAHISIIASNLRITPADVATALNMTVTKYTELSQLRRAKVVGVNGHTPLKQSIRHMSGREITKGQQEANAKLSGMNQSFHVNQIIILIENGLLNTGDERLMERLRKLAGLLEETLAAKV